MLNTQSRTKHADLQFVLYACAELKDVFATFDKNGDGFINFTELKDMMLSMGTDTPNWKVRHVLKDVDQDGESQ